MQNEATVGELSDSGDMTRLPRAPGARRLFALRHAEMFLVADELGDVSGFGDGLFHDDTRMLSRLRVSLGNRQLSLLGSTVSQDNVLFTAHLANGSIPPLGGHAVPKEVIHLVRTRLLWENRLYETLRLTNYRRGEVVVPVAIDFAADFQDMFEVRGEHRKARGRMLAPVIAENGVDLRYAGLDGNVRNCALAFSPAPAQLTAGRAQFLVTLPERQSVALYFEIGTERGPAPSRARMRAAIAQARASMHAHRHSGATPRSSDRLFNRWIGQSRADLALLTAELPTGPYPYAGIPWFATPFGRDAIVTALQMLWLDPSLARGVLGFLAATQAQTTDPFTCAVPGKILHETRKGEMAALGEVPFGRYYGAVDTTPLFIVLAGAYAARTGDLAFIRTLWPALRGAMAWIDGPGDSNGDGLLDYDNGGANGLVNQGWKDSSDSVFHTDGRFPTGPIAVVEVQGYAFAALRAMATLAERLGAADPAQDWRRKAEALRREVEARFWMEDIGYYALALDGEGQPCRIRTSNPGHLLYVGLPSGERAALVTRRLMSGSLNSGWGIRTLAHDEFGFNPMSYHNGSVWPHDTALCIAGMSRYGEREPAVRLLGDMFAAAVHFDMRLPELFCGFAREANRPPVAYPVACLPQAWASGAVFMALQAALGVTVDGWKNEIRIERPALPWGVDRIAVRNIPIGGCQADLVFDRLHDRVAVTLDCSDRHAVTAVVIP
jgi:glycogen debranching enzyme